MVFKVMLRPRRSEDELLWEVVPSSRKVGLGLCDLKSDIMGEPPARGLEKTLLGHGDHGRETTPIPPGTAACLLKSGSRDASV